MFNLRHASARNVIERIFGILKRRFRILLIAPEYDLDIQARIPSALCAIHNFDRKHDPMEEVLPEEPDFFDDDNDGNNGPYPTDDAGEETDAGIMRDRIAQEMWDDYSNIIQQRLQEGRISEDDNDF